MSYRMFENHDRHESTSGQVLATKSMHVKLGCLLMSSNRIELSFGIALLFHLPSVVGVLTLLKLLLHPHYQFRGR